MKEYQFLTCLKVLVRQASSPHKGLHELSVNFIRAELYKLYYHSELFDLNVKGDSAEFLSMLLKTLHACYIDPNLRLKASA